MRGKEGGVKVIEVSMKDVTFSFGQGLKILEGFSFEAEKGEFVYLFGENGSGKSTVLKILCGVMRARSGTVTILGKDPYCNPEILKRTGVVVDGMGFYGECSLRENVLLFAREKGLKDGAEQALDHYIKLWNIDFDTRYKRGSHGMRKIAQLTLSLMNEPDVLIWDEPELALDEKRQEVLLTLLQEHKSKGKTVIVAGTMPTFYGNLVDRTVKKEVVL
jgi:ABC-2 type transport system ATP-binding protein